MSVGPLRCLFSTPGPSGAPVAARSPRPPRPAPRGRRGGLRAVSPRPPGVSLPWLTSFASVCASIFPTSRAEDLLKLVTQFPTLADFDEAVYGKVNTVMGVARPASPALPVPAPASGFGGGERPPPPQSRCVGKGKDGFVVTVPPAPESPRPHL